jgi:uncharacterized protein YidB (DUF937 family)
MSLLNDLLPKSTPFGGLAAAAAENPAALRALLALLSRQDPSVGGSAGLGGVIAAFAKNGLGDVVNSWVARGPNPPVSAEDVRGSLGADALAQFAQKAGLPAGQAGDVIAGLLPTVIDHLTPDGSVPEPATLESSLSGLLAGLGR